MEKIFLTCGEWSATLLPEYGMNTVSLRHMGHTILREPARDGDFTAEMLLHGIPVLLPANRTAGASFEFEDVKYTLPMNEPERGNHLHGSLYCAPFEILDVTDNTVTSRIVNRGEHYPFDFTLTFTDTLTGSGYLRRCVITNDGDKNMPYTFALHSTFNEPREFTVPVGERHEWDENYIPTGEVHSLDEYEKTMLTGCCPAGHLISAPYTSAGNTATIDGYRLTVSDNFDFWVFYNGEGHEGYLCIEPQCGAVNGLNSGRHRTLAPGKSEEFTFEIGIR